MEMLSKRTWFYIKTHGHDSRTFLGKQLQAKRFPEAKSSMNCIEKKPCVGSSLSERCLQRRTSENIRRQEHHNTTQNKRRLLFGLNVDYIPGEPEKSSHF